MDLQARAEKLAAMVEEKLGTRGQGLEVKLARTGRRLPGYLRRDLDYIVQALHMQDNPRLSRQIDWERIDNGFAAAEHHLRQVDQWDRKLGLAINWLAGNALNLLIVVGLMLAVLAWRGLL